MTFKKLGIIQTEIEAQTLRSTLESRGIPHVLKSYHDSALDGLFQSMRGWGEIDAPEEYRDEIISIMRDLNLMISEQDDTPRPGLACIKAGTLDTPRELNPQLHVYWKDHQKWIESLGSLTKHETTLRP